jgi:hypothetical protein
MMLENNKLTACFQALNGQLDTPNTDGSSTAGGCNRFNTGPSLNDGVFHNVAVTREAGVAIKFYIDGVNVKTLSVPNTNTLAIAIPAKVYIGASGFGPNDQNFNGLVDEVCVFASALSLSEINDVKDDGCSDPAEAAVAKVSELRTAFDALADDDYQGNSKSKNKGKNNERWFNNQLDTVLDNIEAEDFEDALANANNIQRKVDGCENSGAPDRNDKILTCDDGDGGGQDLISPLVKDLIAALVELI